ncbi:hypothetical protein BAG01nite_16420 [Brevibacillus agri]|uniref:Uncharacterized protein n=1 Tax=Brevibacillus agri TaxID=51101 RepID=A0ABQ0SQC6_9BACL|nr:hypothetical protein BAG01nite_16420 [Brevibacillus agri]
MLGGAFLILQSGVHVPLVQETLVEEGDVGFLAALQPIRHLLAALPLAGDEAVIDTLGQRQHFLAPYSSSPNKAAHDAGIPIDILKSECADDSSTLAANIG